MKEQSAVSASQKAIAFLVGRCSDNLELLAALSEFEVRIIADDKIPAAIESVQPETTQKLIVLRDFDSEADKLSRVRSLGIRVVGERLILSSFDTVERRLNTTVLFDGPRPVYNHAMRQCVVCFAGAFEPNTIRRLADIVHFQRGSIRKDIVSRRSITHLIAVSPSGEKYRYAVSLGIPVMTVEWLDALWALKDDPDLFNGRPKHEPAGDSKWRSLQDKHRMRPFYALRVLLFGFDDDATKKERMRSETQTHGGFVVNRPQSEGDKQNDADDDSLFITHVVVNDARFPTISKLDSNRRAALIRCILGGGENCGNNEVPAAERSLFSDLLNAIESARRHNETRLSSYESGADDASAAQHQKSSTSGFSVIYANRNVARCSAFTLSVVRSDWFWKSLQIDACVDENAYRFGYGDTEGETTESTPAAESNDSEPQTVTEKPSVAASNLNRTESRFDRLTRMLGRTSIGRAVESDSTSFLDATRDSIGSSTLRSTTLLRSAELSNSVANSTSKTNIRKSNDSVVAPESSNNSAATRRSAGRKSEVAESTAKKLRERTDKLYELLYTESNYVEILDIVSRRLPAELCNPEQPGGPTLCVADARRLFARFEPVYALHAAFKDDLERILGVQMPSDRRGAGRKDVSTACVGDCIRKRCDEFEKAYSRIINDFEHVREELQRTAAENSRFYAFLELLRKRADCGRQDLSDLLIRPVQRLPSLSLILGKMLECTPRSHADFVPLSNALDALQRSLARINENKRTDEKHKELFSIVKQIKNCPATLLSSHRYVVAKATLLELATARRGYVPLVGGLEPLMMLLFNDVIEFCKPRTKQKGGRTTLRGYDSAANLTLNQTALALAQSNATANVSGTMDQSMLNGQGNTLKRKASEREPVAASYKHVKAITLASVKGVIDIVDANSDDPDSSLPSNVSDTLNSTLNSTRASKRERRDREASKRLFGILYDAERNEQLLSGPGTRRTMSIVHSASEQLVAFALVDSGDASKREFLETLCRQIVAVNDDLDVCADSLLSRQDAAFLNVDTEFDRSRNNATMSALKRGTKMVSNALSSFKKDTRTSLASDGRSTPTLSIGSGSGAQMQSHTISGYYGPSSRALFSGRSVSPSAASTCSLYNQPQSDADTDSGALTLTLTSSPLSTRVAPALPLRRVTHVQSSGNLLSPIAAPGTGPLSLLPTNSDVHPLARSSRFGSVSSLGTVGTSNSIAAPQRTAADSCFSPRSSDLPDSLFSPRSVSSIENDDVGSFQLRLTRTPTDTTSESSVSITGTGASKSRRKGLKLLGSLFRMPSIRRQKVEAIREERAADFE